MKHRTRIYYSDAQKALMWERWEARLDAAPDRSPVQSSAYVGPGNLVPHGRNSAAATDSLCQDTDAG